MKTLCAGKPFISRQTAIIPIEETVVYRKSILKNHFFYGSKRPKGLVLVDRGNVKAFNMNFEELPIENFTNNIEGLEDLIKHHSKVN